MSAPPALAPNSGVPAPSPAPSTVSTATAAAGADNAENIWQQMLAKATTKSKEEDSTLIVLGDKKNGKSYVLKKFKDRVLNPKSQEYLLDYSYVNVKNVHDDDPDETRAYMNVWEIDSVEQAGGILPIILRTQGLKNTVYMVTLDLSTPWNIQERLDKWMALLVKAHQSVFSTLPVAEQEAMKLKVSQYNQLFVDASIKAEEKQADKQASSAEPADIKINPDIPPVNLGVPLIIVGCKGDSLAQACASQTGVGDRFEFVTRHLRKFALEYGASLMFTSSVGQSGVGVDILQEYVYHRLYNFELVHASKPVGSETDYGIHVFSGYDSLDLINSIQPAKASWKEEAQFSDVFRDPAQAKQQAAQRHDPEVKADDNEVFFRTLKFTMERGAPTRVRHKINVDGPVAGPATGSGPRTSDAPLPQPETRDARASVGSSSGAPVVVTPPGGTPAAAAAAGGAPGAPRQEQKAVRDFFRSLLTTTNTGAAKPSPAQVRDALHQIKSEKPAQ